jgi:hypothetical protein
LLRSAVAAISASNQLRTAKIRKCWSRVMAGHQARSAVFAHNVPAMTDQQSPKNLLRADRAPHQRR